VVGAGAGCTTVRSVLLQASTADMQITAAAKHALDVMVVSLSNSWFSNGDGKPRLLPIPQPSLKRGIAAPTGLDLSLSPGGSFRWDNVAPGFQVKAVAF
jgi:hypothetical protein